ncbi:hypothetical protein GLT90_01580 [Nanohaloarchaea archaeon H12]|nr:hypothetical protein [Nanohaloarchaea archaeon H12]
MESIRIEFLIVVLVVVSGTLSTNVVGFGGDGNISFSSSEPDPNGTMCVNDFDDNKWDGADSNDLGCVAPLKDVPEKVLDETEGNIWDTDLSNQVGPLEEDMWFGGNVYRGSSTRTMNKDDRFGTGDDGDKFLREFYLDDSRAEGSNWSYGFPRNQTTPLSSFPSDAEFKDGAVIDPPHNQPDARITCGNGIEDDVEPVENKGDVPDDNIRDDFSKDWQDKWGNGDGAQADEDNPNKNLGVAETPCRADYGRIWEKHDRRLVDSSARGISEYKSPNGGTLSCVSDDGRITSSECIGSDNGCSPTGITCDKTLDTDNSDFDGDGLRDESTFYFKESGDNIRKVSCDRKSGTPSKWVDYESCSTSREDCETDEDGDESCSCESAGTAYCGVGRDRVWDPSQSVDCSRHDVVDGGTDSEEDINSSSYEDYPNMGDNDPAATWTEFTAHSDNSWGSRTKWEGTTGDEAFGSVWCGYQDATTLDADGPNGGLDGYVVISNRGKYSSMDRGRPDTNFHVQGSKGNKIIGAYSPDSSGGADADDVWLDGSYTNAQLAIERKLRAKGKMDCPEDNQICVVRIDKINYDELEKWKETWDFRNGVWYRRDEDSPRWDNGFKVKASDLFLPSESYSVCKLANRGAGQEVVDCDYMKDGGAHSPLPEACGDQPGERMIAQEGNEINHETIDKYPALKQECYDYGASLKDEGYKNYYKDYRFQDWGPTLENKYSSPDSRDDERYDNPVDGIDTYNLEDTNIRGGSEKLSGHWIYFAWDTLRRQKNYTLTTTFNMDDNREHTLSAVFDWDRNGNFENDETYEIGSCRGDGCEVAENITVPEDAETGASVMRVREKSSDDADYIQFGEVYTNVFYINKSKKNLGKPTEDACVLNGQIYPEGSLIDVSNEDFDGIEEGGGSADKEVCIGGLEYTGSASSDENLPRNWYSFQSDNGGVWVDVDNYEVTEYIRENKPLDSQSYKENWVSNPDKNASKNPSKTGVKPEYVNEKGFALEDDCKLYGDTGQTIDCEDIGGGIGQEIPTWARFTEGAMNDDFNGGNVRFDVNLNNVHNRVQSGGNTGHPQAEPLSVRDYVVDDNSEWSNGNFFETESKDGYLKTTESSDSGDKNFDLGGTEIYGKYVSETFTTTEELFSKVTVYNEVSPGEVGGHPIVVEYAEDSSFSTNADSQKFYFNESESQDQFDLGAEPEQEYLRFKIGVSDEPLPNQVTFAVDQSGSMGTPIQGVRNNVKWFYDQLGANSEGTIIGAVNNGRDGSYGDYEPADYVSGEGLVTSEEKLLKGAERLSNNGGAQGPDVTIAESSNFDPEASDYQCDPADSNYQCDENYNYREDSKKAIIWIQYGGTGPGTCDEVGDFSSGALGNHLVEKDFRFYAVVNDLSGCRSNYEEAAANTGGKVYTLAASPDPEDWRPVLNEIRNDLVGLGEDNLVDRVEVTASTPADYDGSGNTQDDEPESLSDPASSEFLEWYEDSEIDARDDEWAYTPALEWGIANNGSAWPPSACHGAPRERGVNKKKEDAVYANSYIRADQDVYNRGRSDGRSDGNWINPDNTTLSVREGGLTCDLTGEDWGYAVRTSSISDIECLGGDCDAAGDPSSDGLEGVDESIPHQVVVPEEGLTFDSFSDPEGYNQDNLKQWPDACGDDRNEFLIREHAAELDGEYDPVFSGRNDYYVCADRPTDCALDGRIYTEGQLADVGGVTEETGVESEDQEVCLDVVEELPGGEWYDVDNETLREHLIESGSPDNPEEYVRTGQIEPANPGKPFWHNSSTGDSVRDEALREARDSPYSPLGPTNFYDKGIDFWRGYALEDDCDSDVMSGCDDKGIEETRGTDSDPSSDLIYSHFRESKGGMPVKADDYSEENTWVVRMFVNGSSDHGSNTGQMNENTEGVNFKSSNWGPEPDGWPTTGLNDSAINETEDTWAIASETYDAVGPTGTVYDTGQCYGRSPPQHSEGWVLKNETIMANSFANRTDVNSDGHDEGNWVDPDTTERTVSRGILTCDLNSTDWGIGYDLGPGSSLNVYEGDARSYGYNITDRHAVSGPIAFDYGEKPLGEEQDDLKQYPDACGDDQNEFLIREQYSSYHGGEIYPNLTDRDDIYACADRITDCAYNGAVYSEGQTFDISSEEESHNQEMGEQLPDEEICLDLNKSTPGGEWYDKDQEFTLEHRIKGLKDTYNVSNPSFTASTQIDISGVVEGESDGIVNITDTDTPVNSDGSFFMNNVDADPGGMQLLRYYNSTGQLEAQIRLRFPSDESNVKRVHISPELMYNGSEVWSGMETFSDHDFDRNKYNLTYNSTDWRNQTTRYDRTDLAYFNRTGEYYSPPSHRTNVRGQQKRYYSPEGYATEDDCGPLLSKSSTGPCGDVGDDTQHQSWFSAGNFTGMAP